MNTPSFLWQNMQQNFKYKTQDFVMEFGDWYMIYEEQEVPSWPWDVSAICSSAVDSVRAETLGT